MGRRRICGQSSLKLLDVTRIKVVKVFDSCQIVKGFDHYQTGQRCDLLEALGLEDNLLDHLVLALPARDVQRRLAHLVLLEQAPLVLDQ